MTTVDVRRRLSDPDLPHWAAELGFAKEDRDDLVAYVGRMLDHDEELTTVTRLAERVVHTIGSVGPEYARRAADRAVDDVGPSGVLPMLALFATAPEAAAFHASRGVPPDISAATLADLGQQVHVHRLSYGKFGLHTHTWVDLVWSGSLFRLGRLQFNLALEQPEGRPEWVLSTHIPRTGPLPPESVEASFAAATTFFATHFPDHPTGWFHCRSWLLDPTLSVRLPDSNLAAFQRRWSRYGPAEPGEDDLMFFVFSRRGGFDPAALPTDTALRRLAAERLTSGEGWQVYNGLVRQ